MSTCLRAIIFHVPKHVYVLTCLYTFSMYTCQLFRAYMRLYLPCCSVFSTGACAETKILIFIRPHMSWIIISPEVLKKIYHIQHVCLVQSSRILENQFLNKIRKLNLKTDGLMLMIYIKKSSNLQQFLGLVLVNRRWSISLQPYFNGTVSNILLNF